MENKLKGYSFVALSGILFGVIIFGGQIFANIGLSLFELSTLPYIFSLVFLFPFIIQKKFWVDKRNFLILLILGVVEVFCTIFQFAGLVFGASVAVVVLLLYAQPLWTTIISYFFLKEKINKWHIISCVLVIFGVIFLVNPAELFSSKSVLGVLAALLGGIFLSLWVVLGSLSSKQKINAISIKFYVGVISLVLLFLSFPVFSIFYPASNITSFSLSWPLWVWVALALFNLFIITFGHVLYFTGSKFIPTVSSGILLLLEPVVGVILSVVFLSQPLTIPIVLGGFLILFGNFIIITRT
jgi:drug/metabolite transporter, DME family